MANKLLLAILLLNSLNGIAQQDYTQSQISISGPFEVYPVQVEAPGIDHLFVVKGSSLNGVILDIAPKEEENQDEDQKYTFEWKRFDPDSKTWSILIATGNRSSYPLSTPGGYQVIVSKGENTVKTARSWVFTHQLDDFQIEVVEDTCDILHLSALPQPSPFTFFDELGNAQEQSFQYRWSAEEQTTITDNPQLLIDAPLKDQGFLVELIL